MLNPEAPNFVDPTGLAAASLISQVGKRVVKKFIKGQAHTGFKAQIRKVSERSLQRTIRSLEKRIQKHERTLNDPTQLLSKRHHEHEIRVFKEQLELARGEAASRTAGRAAVGAALIGAATLGGAEQCAGIQQDDSREREDSFLDIIVDFIVDPEIAE